MRQEHTYPVELISKHIRLKSFVGGKVLKQLSLRPVIYKYNTVEEFCKIFKIGKGDLIITNEFIYNPLFEKLGLETKVVFQEKYGLGEPTDEIIENIYIDLIGIEYKRVIGIGGGTVLDISKIFALKNVSPVIKLFDKKLEIIKNKELVLLPTTCGTGSEVTNIAILEFISRKTKLGLASDEMYADSAIIIPELLYSLPYEFFATSSIDAFIHAAESYVSPKATQYTDLYSLEAIKIIISGYKRITEVGKDGRIPILENFLIASNFAGIAFSNAGVGAVHAMSYPFGGLYHIPHGEANYVFFTEIFRTYTSLKPKGKIYKLNNFLAKYLECDVKSVYNELDILLDNILKKRSLHEYGVTDDELLKFTKNVTTMQSRLTANNYVTLDFNRIYTIYRNLM